MLITRKSQLTGKVNSMELDVTPQQMSNYEMGTGLLQHIFPHLPPPQREFIKSGITPEEWDEIFNMFDE